MSHIPSYIQDTRDFIKKIENKFIPDDAVLLSMDVVSLYTSIPQDDIRSTIQMVLEKENTGLPPMHFILDLVDILIEKNYFYFAGNYYFQTIGVSMGSPFTPSVANLFMSDLENQTILHCENNPFYSSILMFFRFIDDCFCIFKGAHQIKNFIEWLNTVHPTI